MPLSPFQKQIMQLLTPQRGFESYVAGGAPIAAVSDRRSVDFDIFHDRAELLADAVVQDTKALADAGFQVEWIRQSESMCTAQVVGGPEPLKIDWAQDSAFRFYPAQRDPDFGYVLHPADLATNKVLAAAGRSEPRDLVDLITLNSKIPIPSAIIAAPAKDPGFTPEMLCEYITRFSRHRPEDFDTLLSDKPIDGKAVLQEIRQAVHETQELLLQLPSEAIGKLYLENFVCVVPKPGELSRYLTREASVGGVLPIVGSPTAAEIAARYNNGVGR